MKVLLFTFIAISFLLVSCGKEEEPPRDAKLNGTKQLSSDTELKATQAEIVKFSIPSIHCEGCENTISESVSELGGIEEISIDSNKVATIKYNSAITDKIAIKKQIEDAGYEAKEI